MRVAFLRVPSSEDRSQSNEQLIQLENDDVRTSKRIPFAIAVVGTLHHSNPASDNVESQTETLSMLKARSGEKTKQNGRLGRIGLTD